MQTFALDLRRSAQPTRAVGGTAVLFNIRRPQTGFDKRRGLHFPLTDAGLLFQNNGKLNDAAGSLTISFSLDKADTGGLLFRSFGDYLTLIVVDRELQLSLYGHELRLGIRGRSHTVTVAWDHQRGFSLATKSQRITRRITWRAYRQRYIPVEIGGNATELRPNRTRWQNSFTGWIQTVTLHTRPPRLPSERLILRDPVITDSPLRFDCIPDRLANYRRCRKLHPELEDLYFGAPTAFEGLKNVARYVSNLWPHTSYWPWPRQIFTDRGDRLLTDIKAGNCGGMCGGYAHTMEECLWALGVPARRVQVYHHSALEAYDHTHDKWILLETDNAHGYAGVWINRAGIPCCIGELIDLYEQERLQPGITVEHVPLGAECPGGVINNRFPEWWLRYCYILMGWYHGDRSFWYAPKWYRLTPPVPYEPAKLQQYVADWRQLYWPCDRVLVERQDRRGVVQLKLQAFQAQFFRDFEICVDGQTTHQRADRFEWRLHPGENRIAIRTRNRLGARGHPWQTVIHRHD